MSNRARDRKTEQLTARRLRKAREEGSVPFSRDVAAAAVLLAVLGAAWFGRHGFVDQVTHLGRYALQASWPSDSAGQAPMVNRAVEILEMLLYLTLPISLIAAVAAIVVNFVQARGLFAPKIVTPRGERVNPVDGFHRLFSMSNAVEFGKSVIKIVALTLTLGFVIGWAIPTLVKLPNLDVGGVVSVSAIVFATFFSVATAIYCLIAVFDAWFQRVNHIRVNRMTREEVKRERRDDEGDPHMRAQRRRLGVELAGESLLDRTAQASVVIHSSASKVAVALFVDQDPDILPWLLNKGHGPAATAIIAVARQNNVKTVQDSRLAQLIERNTAIDGDVPKRFAGPIRSMFD